MNLLAIHDAARGGDGLRPEIHRLLEQRTALKADPKIALLERFGGVHQAGPNPPGKRGNSKEKQS